MEKVKLSDLTRKSLSADLASADYLPFNDADQGTDATRAVTIGAMDSFFKHNVNHLARTAVSGALMPSINTTTLSGANFRSSAGVIANSLTAVSIDVGNLSASNLHANNSVSATTVSGRNVMATTLYGTLKGNVDTDSGTSSFGNVHIDGDLRVFGSTVTTSAQNLSVRDPIIEVAKDQTAPEVDFGILGNRGSSNNSAVIFDESADQWTVVYTTDDATTSGNITIASYADFRAHGGIFTGVSGDGSNLTSINAAQVGINSLAELSASGDLADADNFIIYDTNATANKKVGLDTIKSFINATAGVDTDQARSAVSGSDMVRLLSTTITGTNIRGTNIETSVLSGTQIFGAGSNITALNATQLTSGSIPDARVPSSNVTQHQSSLALATSQITSGTFADARIASSNVTQHQGDLTLATSQITSGTLADARVAASNVTQHQASLTILKSQVTDFDFFARTAVTGTAAFQATQYVGTVYANLSGDASAVSGLTTGQIPSLATSKITSGTFANARIAESNVTQHEAALTVLKSQVTDFDFFARSAVTGTAAFQASKYVGTVYANLSGDASAVSGLTSGQIPSLAAGKITSGTFADARIAESNVTQHQAALSLAATQLASGSIPDARVPASNVTQHQASLTITKSQVTDFDFFARTAVTGTAAFQASKYVGTVYANLSGNASAVSGLTSSQIPSLAADKITSGTLGADRIPSLATSKITSGTFADARIASSNVTQHQGDLTVTKAQLTDFDFFARTAVTGTSSFQATQYVGTVYGNLSGDASAVSGLAASQIPSLATSKITSGTFANARVAESNVTQHEAALTILKSQVTDFDFFARTAVSGSLMPVSNLTTLSAANIRSTAGAIFNTVTAATLQVGGLDTDGTLSAGNLHADNSVSATTVSGRNVMATTLFGTLNGQVNTDLDIGSGTSNFGNVHIEGDLRVHGNTVTTSAQNLSVRDPIIEVAKDQTAPEVDFGILGNRGSAQNSGVIYDESADQWSVIFTTDDATTSGNITIASYADFKAHGGIFVGVSGDGSNVTGIAAGNIGSGTLNNARVAESNVTQHQSALSIAATQLASGSIPDARVPASNVTQHQAALTVTKSQLTDFDLFARTAVTGTPVFFAKNYAGTVYANLSGDASAVSGITAGQIPNLDTGKLTSGTLADARVAESNVTQHQAALSLAATQLTSGSIPNARVPSSNVTQHQASLTIAKTQVTDFDFFARSAVTGAAAFQAVGYVGTVYANLSGDASAVSGLTSSQIPSLAADKITSGTLGADRIPSLATSKITSGTFADGRIAESNVTQHQAALTIGKTQVTDFDFFARTAVTGTAAFQASQYVGTVYANLSGNASAVSGLTSGQIPSLATSKITSGTFADARIAESNVTQHQAAISIATSQIGSGTLANARVAESNVTQHQAALTILKSQVTDFDEFARTAVSGSNIVKLTTTTLSGSNIRGDNVESSSVSGTDVFAGNGVYIGGTAAANRLDAYNEGTWTPAFTLGSGSVGYATQSGAFTRIGNLVYATFEIELNSNSSADGAMTIGGLPVAAANSTGGVGVGGLVVKHMKFETARSELPSVVNVNLRVVKNTQTAQIVFSDDSVDVFEATGASLSSDTVIQGSFFYQA